MIELQRRPELFLAVTDQTELIVEWALLRIHLHGAPHEAFGNVVLFHFGVNGSEVKTGRSIRWIRLEDSFQLLDAFEDSAVVQIGQSGGYRSVGLRCHLTGYRKQYETSPEQLKRRHCTITSPPHGRAVGHASAFGYRQNLIGFDILQCVDSAAGPANLQFVGPRRIPQTEVDAEVALRQVAGPRFDFPNQNLAADRQLQARPDPVSIALRPDGSNHQGIAAVSAIVSQEFGCLANVS